jgi:hypothetical protein
MPRDSNKKTYLTLPKPAVVADPVQSPSFGQSMQHGLSVGVGAGIGSSIGHGVGRYFSERFFGRPQTEADNKCVIERRDFENCLRTNSSCEDKQYSFQQCLQN